MQDYFGDKLFSGKLETFELRFVHVDKRDLQMNSKADKHIGLYALNELYEMHKDHASRILNSIRSSEGGAKRGFLEISKFVKNVQTHAGTRFRGFFISAHTR